jgi:hypothetical protein
MLIPELQRDLVEAAGRLSGPRRRLGGLARHLALGAVGALVAAAVLLAGNGTSDRSESPKEPSPPASPPGHHTRPPQQGTIRPPPREPRPLPGSESGKVVFRFQRVSYSAVGFRGHGRVICATLTTELGKREPLTSSSCAGQRVLRRALARDALYVASGGGGRHTTVSGFARESVSSIRAVASRGVAKVALSKPWRPVPWGGEPIRFFYVATDLPLDIGHRASLLPKGLHLQGQLATGQVAAPGP